MQSDSVRDAIRISAGVVPALAFLIAISVFARFSFNEVEHAAVVDEADDNTHSGIEGSSPLASQETGGDLGGGGNDASGIVHELPLTKYSE